MKITATQYAKSLHEITAGKSQQEIDGMIANVIKLLEKNRQTKLMPKIIAKFSEIYNKENGIVEAEITTSNKIQDTMTKQIEKFVKEKYSAKEVVIKNIIDEKIKGGIVIKVGDEILDGSVAGQLNGLKKALTK